MTIKVELVSRTQLNVDGIVGFMERKVVRYGTGAAVICPKEFLGRKAYLVITKDIWEEEDAPEVGRFRRARAL
jgi:putative transposon-encoded protein